MDKASNYTPKVPGTQPKAPSEKTREKRAQLKKQHHAHTLSGSPGVPVKKVSLKTPDKPVKTEAPIKKMRSSDTLDAAEKAVPVNEHEHGGTGDRTVVQDLLLELLQEQPKGGTPSLRALLLQADNQLRVEESGKVSSKIDAILNDLPLQKKIEVAASFNKLDPSDQGIYPVLARAISAVTSVAAPEYFVKECLDYRHPPTEVLVAMEKVERAVTSDPIHMSDFLKKAFGEGLDHLSSDAVRRLDGRLTEDDMLKSHLLVVQKFRRVVVERAKQLNKEAESKGLLPQPMKSDEKI